MLGSLKQQSFINHARENNTDGTEPMWTFQNCLTVKENFPDVYEGVAAMLKFKHFSALHEAELTLIALEAQRPRCIVT